MTSRRTGWLGGSFDPVHSGHLAIARAAADRFELQRVLLIPAHRPPHKTERTLAPDADRLALLEIACRIDPRLQACDIEMQRSGLSYSFDTARELLQSEPEGTQLFYIIGADTLVDLPNWHRIADLCRLVTFVSIARAGQPLDPTPLRALIGDDEVRRIAEHCLELSPHPASSTAIRADLAAGRRPEHVDDEVWAEIVARGLYGAGGRSDSSRRGGSGTAIP